LGPATYPLWRPDILDHLQILVSTHDLLPHEAAIPYSLTGTRLGRPTQAGTGAFVTKHFGGTEPTAYVLKGSGGLAADNLVSAATTGTLGASARPLFLEVPCGGPSFAVLDREATPDQDALLEYYINQYKSRLSFPDPDGDRIRSPVFDDYEATSQQFFNLDAIRDELNGYDASSISSGAAEGACIENGANRCPGEELDGDSIRQSMNLAGYLLNRPNTRYVCVIDTGRNNSGGAGYDTHDFHARDTYRNLTNTLHMVAEMTDPNRPGGPVIPEFTMIVITTEFGRTPNREGGTGRGHYPTAYTNLIIPAVANAPVPYSRPTRRVVGGIDADASVYDADGSGIDAITPTDLRAAMLMALAIDPFVNQDGDGFGVGDLSENVVQGGGEPESRINLIEKVLGYDLG
jgi:hypothetical protein